MALFDSIIGSAREKFGLSNEGSGGLVAALLALITDPRSGGFGGFIDKFRNAGLGPIVDSWISTGSNEPLSGDQVESALGADAVDGIATRAGVDRGTASAALGGIIPGVVDTLTPDGDIPDDSSILSKIGGFLSDWGGAIGGAVAGGVGAAAAMAGGAADKVGDAAGATYDKGREVLGDGIDAAGNIAGAARDKVSGAVGNVYDAGANGGGSILKWLIPLLLLGLLVVLGFMFCGRGTPTANVTTNTNVNRLSNTNANANAARAVESSFKLVAADGKYTVSGVVPNQATLDQIKAKLDAQFGAGNVDYSGLKIDATAKPFDPGWWTGFEKMLPNLKDWKTGTLAFAGNAITEASGLPSAALDQLKSLFAGWTLPNSLGEAARSLAEVSLPNGTKLQAYPGGIEDQLVKFIQSDDYKNGTNDTLKEKWFSFDDLNFVFGKTELTPESKRQLDNITAILKAFPDVKIKIGGYTDKKGDDAANKKLSDDRAKAVQAALQKAGVGAQVPEAEGYGEEFATVEESASDEARKVDRKTAVRLIK